MAGIETTRETPSPTRTVEEEVLARAAALFPRYPGVVRVLLYGSRATGDAQPDSDVDFLVVLEGNPRKRTAATELRALLRGSPLPIDISVMGETEFEETKHVVGGLAYPANKYGRVLYEAARAR